MRIGAFEAKNKLGHLLNLVEAGEEIVITRHGREVARLVRADRARSRDETRAAILRIRQRAREGGGGQFDWGEWKSYRDDGRR